MKFPSAGKGRRSLGIVLLVWVAVLVSVLRQPPGNAFAWDSFGYHLYLPAFFEQGDPLLTNTQWVDDARVKYNASGTLYQITVLEDGDRVIKYPLGLALLWAPWYAMGHVAAVLSEAPVDGYSRPYQWCVMAGVLLYFLLGLLALRAALLRRFSDGVTAVALLLVTVGTNYIDQAMHGLTMPHAILFSLYAGILLFTLRWHEQYRTADAVKLAVLMGFTVLCRPSEVVCVLLPLLWAPAAGFKAQIIKLWQRRSAWLMMAGIMFLIGLPQFLYWKAAAGSFFVDSYFNAGEGFDWLRPHTIDFLFSFRKGWFLYTPLMLVAVAGILVLRKRWPQAFVPVLVFFLANLYVVSSWTCWWYADSFGSRAMVGSLAVMALPLAALLEQATTWKWVARWAFSALLAALLCFNLFQQWQFSRGIIHSSRMTRGAYLAGFGRTAVPEGSEDLLRVRRSYSGDDAGPDSLRYRRITLPMSLTTAPPSELDTLVRDTVSGGDLRAVRLDKDHIFSPAIHLPFHDITLRDHAWVEAHWSILPRGTGAVKGSFVITFEHNGNYAYHAYDVDALGLKPDVWNDVRTDYLTPEVRDPDDPLVAYFWLRDTVSVLVMGPRIIVHEPLRNR